MILQKMKTACEQALQIVIFAIFLVLIVLVFSNVVARYLLNSGLPWAYETSRWLFVWMVFLGAVVGLVRSEHMATDMITSRLPKTVQFTLGLVCILAMALVCGLILTGSLKQAFINLNVPLPVTAISNSIFYWAAVFFAIAAEVVLISQFVRHLRRWRR